MKRNSCQLNEWQRFNRRLFWGIAVFFFIAMIIKVVSTETWDPISMTVVLIPVLAVGLVALILFWGTVFLIIELFCKGILKIYHFISASLRRLLR